MKINTLSLTSATALDLAVSINAPVCLLCGSNADLVLDLAREGICDFGATQSPDRVDDGRFVLHADIEADGKHYSVCYIRNADFMGDHRIAVNFTPNGMAFSHDDTEEYLRKITKLKTNDRNVFDKTKYETDLLLSESDRYITGFARFLEQIPTNDERPVFIYGFFDHIDQATDVTAYLDALTRLGRQVLIAVCSNYPIDRLKHNAVQIVNTEAQNGEN